MLFIDIDCYEKESSNKGKGRNKSGDTGKGKKKELKKVKKNVVYCVNVEQLVYFIKQKRGINDDDDDMLYKIGLGTIQTLFNQDRWVG